MPELYMYAEDYMGPENYDVAGGDLLNHLKCIYR